MYLPKDDMKSVVIPTNIGILYPILKKNVISFKKFTFCSIATRVGLYRNHGDATFNRGK